jgi:hypothetical protein
MTKNIISLVLLLVSAGLSFKHGWDTFYFKDNPQSGKMMAELGISESIVPMLGVFTMLLGVMLLFPQTFFMGNLLSAFSIVTIMALSLQSGNYKIAFMEIPFLILPLLLIWLKYPFKN